MPSFKYRTFGLVVESEIESPGLAPSDGATQIRIRRGAVPHRLESPTFDSPAFQNAPGEFLARLDNLGRFLVSQGTDIVVEAATGASETELGAYLFGSLFGMVLHQRRTLPLHASAIETSQGAVLFCGSSGNGKSTLAGEFYRRGYRILSDDVCAITSESDGPFLHPARSLLLLKDDSLDRLGLSETLLQEAPHRIGKRMLPVGEACVAEFVPIHAVYALEPSLAGEMEVVRCRGFDKLEILTSNIYRLQLVGSSELFSYCFGAISVLSKCAKVSVAKRPIHGFRLAEFANHLEEDFTASNSLRPEHTSAMSTTNLIIHASK